MKENEFVKKFGINECKNILNGRKSWVDKKSGSKLTDNSFVLVSKKYECAIGTLYMGDFLDYDENSYRSGEINLLLLNRLVESHELVNECGGLPAAKAHLEILADRCANGGLESIRGQYKNLKKAIADVESCL